MVTYLISGVNLTGPDNNITYNYRYEPCPVTGCPPPAIDYGPYEARCEISHTLLYIHIYIYVYAS